MRALEMEDDEVESFLDSQENNAAAANGRAGVSRIGGRNITSNSKSPRPSSTGGGSSCLSSLSRKYCSMGKVIIGLVTLILIALFVFNYDTTDEGLLGEEEQKLKPPSSTTQPPPAPAPAEKPAEEQPAPPQQPATEPPQPPKDEAPAPAPVAEDKSDDDDDDEKNLPAAETPTETNGEQDNSPPVDDDAGAGAGDDAGNAGADIEGGGEELPDNYGGGGDEGNDGGDYGGGGDEEGNDEEYVEDGEEDEDENEKPEFGDDIAENYRVYSKYATIVPNPYHPTPKADDEADTAKIDALKETWGKWGFYDGEEENRPSGNYLKDYPNGDMPADDFPEETWQADAVFVNHILDAGENLVERAKEAIYTEYGKGKDQLAAAGQTMKERMTMFRWELLDFSKDDTKDVPEEYTPLTGTRGNGGWTTERSFNGLVRRLLHAMHVNDVFTVVVMGHSRPSGNNANHFHQTYAMQFQYIMSPIFARMGVKLETRNMAQANMSTIHQALGFQDLVGDSVDLVIWDCDTEDLDNVPAVDLLYRQALLSGKKVPVIWGGDFSTLRTLHQEADVDVGDFGWATGGLLLTESEEQVKTLPPCVRYMKCTPEAKDLCDNNPNKFCTQCLFPRDDNSVSKELFDSIRDKPLGQEEANGIGWQLHQLIGRNLAFAVVDAMQEVLQIWSDGTMGGPPLDEGEWHVTEYYENIRTKVKNLDPSIGECYKLQEDGKIPGRVCKTPMKGRTLHTPRYKPNESSLISIIRPNSLSVKPKNTLTQMYDGPDKYNTNQCYSSADDVNDLDVYAIVSNRRRQLLRRKQRDLVQLPATDRNHSSRQLAGDDDGSITLGDSVWDVKGEKPGECDGGYSSICGRAKDDDCPALGSHDSRGELQGNEEKGWVIFDIPDLKEGIVILRYSSGEPTSEEVTLPDTFVLEFAINGKITSWKKEELLQKTGKLHSLVQVVTLLDDESFDNEGKEVELAIRTLGCPAESCSFEIPHIYWA